MKRIWLRHRGQRHALDEPLVIIGRSATCQMTLDDALVSRRHAALRATEEGYRIEDLGSRNGISVNGLTVQGSRPLHAGDRIVIGMHEFVVEDGAGPAERASEPSAWVRDALQGAARSRSLRPDEDTQTGNLFDIIEQIAEKQLALGRTEEAARLLRPHLDTLHRRLDAGQAVSEERLTQGRNCALLMAEASTEGHWLDWVFGLQQKACALLPEEEIDRLHEIVRALAYRQPAPIRGYLAALHERGGKLSANEKFRLGRIEALERVISA